MAVSYIWQVVGGVIEVGQIGPVAVCENEILRTPYRYDEKTPHRCNLYFEVLFCRESSF
jgi:hypothetical protein